MMRLRRRLRNLLVMASDCVPVHRSGGRIIALHDVPDRNALRERLAWLQRHYTIQPLKDLLTSPADRAVALTFDDGYASWHDVAMPVLKALGLPATFFLCSGFIGLEGADADRFLRNRIRRTSRLTPLTRGQVQRLADVPQFEVGSHTVTHADLAPLTPRQISVEVADDRSRLEAMTGRRVSMFAYPFGQPPQASAEAMKTLELAGFEWAFTIVPQFVERAAGRFCIGRDSLDIADSKRVWSATLRGSYDWLYRMRPR